MTTQQSFLSELKKQLETAVPSTLCMLLYRIPWLISLVFVGSIGSKELAAAALATTLCNITGMSLSVGLSSAITTLTGQARGEMIARGKEKIDVSPSLNNETTPLIQNTSQNDDTSPLLPLVYLYRGIFIQLAFVLPVGCYWIYGIKPLLLLLGQGEDISTMTEQYLRLLTPGLWGYSINWTLTSWLQVIELAHIPAYAALFGDLLHIPMNLFFIHAMKWGYLGVGVATSIFQVVQPIVMFAYLKGTKHGHATLLDHVGAKSIGRTSLSFWCEAKMAISSIVGVFQYLMLALPGILAISEWWASELCIFYAGRLTPDHDIALGAMTIYQSINSSCFMFPVGISVSGTSRVGHHLGSGNVKAARLSGLVCIVGTGLFSISLGSMLYLTPHKYFPSLFTSDVKLIEMTSKVIPLLSIYVIADGLQMSMNAIIKGCGRQLILIPIVIVSYWLIAVPLSYHLAFVRSGGTTDCGEQASFCSVVGLVGGLTMGTWMHFILLAIYCSYMIDWQSEADLATERLSLEKRTEYNEEVRDDVSLSDVVPVKALDI